jgi:hypothetical protein
LCQLISGLFTAVKTKGRHAGGQGGLFLLLRLFEDTVPKHDEYHQGDREYDHGLKISLKILPYDVPVKSKHTVYIKIINYLTF